MSEYPGDARFSESEQAIRAAIRYREKIEQFYDKRSDAPEAQPVAPDLEGPIRDLAEQVVYHAPTCLHWTNEQLELEHCTCGYVRRLSDVVSRLRAFAEQVRAPLEAEIRRLQIARIGDSEIIGRETCRAEAAEAALEAEKEKRAKAERVQIRVMARADELKSQLAALQARFNERDKQCAHAMESLEALQASVREKLKVAWNWGFSVGRDTDEHPAAQRARDIDRLLAAPEPPRSFQARVRPWMLECFGAEMSRDVVERCDRFIEEAFELVQAFSYPEARIRALIDYVYARPHGEHEQEVGGVMVTLAALCLASEMDMHAAGETELARVWTKVDRIRAKQAAKPKGSALPMAPEPQARSTKAADVLGWVDSEGPSRTPPGQPLRYPPPADAKEWTCPVCGKDVLYCGCALQTEEVPRGE